MSIDTGPADVPFVVPEHLRAEQLQERMGIELTTWTRDEVVGRMPVAGNRQRMVGGTLRYRMNGTRAANNARAKTGTLTGVTALSGYVRGRDGRRYVFAMLSEHSGASPRPVENRFVQALAGWRR